jgi:hypothetical protein
MNQFVVNVQKMQQLTQQLTYQVQNKVSIQQMYISHHAATNRMMRMLQIFRKASASLQGALARIMRAMGPSGNLFVRGLFLAAEMIGPIISASISVAVSIGKFTVGALTSGIRLIKWFWDKMVGLGDAMLEDFLIASGSLSSISGVRAWRATFGNILGDPNFLSNVAVGRESATSRQFIALQMLGVKNLKDSTDMMVQATVAAHRFMKTQGAQRELMMAEAAAITSLIRPEALIRISEMTEEEIQEYKKLIESYKPLMKVDEKAVKGWMNFSMQVKAAGAQIMAVIAEKLADKNAPFTKALQELSESILYFFQVIIKSPVTKELIRKLSGIFENFGRWLSDPGRKKNITKAMDDIKDIIKLAFEAFGYIKQIVELLTGKQFTPSAVKVFRPGIRRPGALVRDPKTGQLVEPSHVQVFRPGIRRPGAIAPDAGRTLYRDIRPATGDLRGGQVNSSDLYNAYKKAFTGSSLDGYVPKDGARWGIVKGTPDEWARLATTVSKQESGLRANAPGGGLNQFEQRDLQNYGVGGSVNDPNAQVQALVNQWTKDIRRDGVVSQPAPGNAGPGNAWLGAGRYFGSMRDKGWHGKQQSDIDKYLRSGGWADQAQAAAQGKAKAGAVSPGAVKAVGDKDPEAFIMHHTGGQGTAEGVVNTLRQRGLGVQYVMERDGTIKQIGGPGAAHMMPEARYRQSPILGKDRPFLQNQNVVGMEVIALNDRDVTPAQVAAARKFIAEKYPNTPVFGHGEVNPGHKEADEGMTIVNAIRGDRARAETKKSYSQYRTELMTGSNVYPFDPDRPVRSVPHPIQKLKIDNRSDEDVVHTKTNSDNDAGEPELAEDLTK